MKATTALARPEPVRSSENASGADPVSGHANPNFRTVFEMEFGGVIDRLIAATAAETDAAIGRAVANHLIAVDAAQAARDEQARRNDVLTELILQREIDIEELQAKLQTEGEDLKSVRDALEIAHSARERAEAERDEGQSLQEQVVSEYETQLHAVRAELDLARAELKALKAQLDAEICERGRVQAALKAVQQACALADGQASTHQQIGAGLATADDSERDQVDDVVTTDEIVANAASTERTLKLVATTATNSDQPSAALLQYFNELFDQIDAMYGLDQHAHASVDVVDRLSANLLYARDLFTARALAEPVNGARVFDQELSKRLYDLGSAPLGRHLAVAAYALSQTTESPARAEAS